MMGLPTLYLSADMTGYQASMRLACMQRGLPTERMEAMMEDPASRAEILGGLSGLNMTFSYGSPITWHGIEAELEAYAELHNQFPEVIVIDNLMDMEGCESAYEAQVAAMQDIHTLKTEIGSTIFVLHHATDKSRSGKGVDPGKPSARWDIKNGLTEKPESILTVALDPVDLRFRVAPVKSRTGFQDESGETSAILQAYPSLTRFASE